MTISRRLPDLAPYYRLVKNAAAAGARSVAHWIGAGPQPSTSAPSTSGADAASIAVEQGYVRGWMVDAAGSEGKPLRVFLDGKLIGVITADVALPKIGRRFKLPTVRHGFRFPIPPAALDGGSHAVAVQTLDKRTRRTIRFVAPPDGEGPRIELLALSESGVRGVLRNGYDDSEGPELWVGDGKLAWPAAVTRLTPREDLATAFEIDLLKPELGALLRQGLRFALPGGREVGVTTGLVDLLSARFARSAPDRLRVTTRVAAPRLDGVAFQIELSADPDFEVVSHRANVELSGGADVVLPANLAGQAIWARLVLEAGDDRTAGDARHVPADGQIPRPLYAFDPAAAGEPQVWRDPPSGAELVQGAHVQYEASSAETCAVALSAASDDRPATLTCDAAAEGAGVRLCFPVPLGTTQGGDRIRLSFAARARPDGGRGVAFTLMSSRGSKHAKAFVAALGRPETGPDGWMRQDLALVLADGSRADILDLVIEIEPGAGVAVARVSAQAMAAGGDAEAGGEGRRIRVEAAPRTVGAAWFDGEAIVGWAVDEADPRRPVTVEIMVDGRPDGRVVATDMHPVLIGRGHNYGRCAFRLAAPAALRDGERHVVSARVLDGAALPGSPMTVRMAPPGPASPPTEAPRRIAAGDRAPGGRFVALRAAATAPGERRDVLERQTEGPRDALFDEQVRRLTADLARTAPDDAAALTAALAGNETEVARRAAAFEAAEPLVSIVMPTFNRAFLIADAIQSVVDQSWSNWELIVCDDGSVDKTAAVVKGFGDPRIRYLPLEKSNGAVARNFGLRFSRGGFIAFLDTDNVWHPDFLRMCVAELSGSAAPFCFTSYVDASIRGARYVSGEVRETGFDYLALLDRNAIDLNAIVLRASVYETLGGFDERLQRVQDWDLLLRYGLVFEPLAIPAVGALYRRNPAWSQVTDLAGHTDDQAIVRDKALAALKAEPATDGAERSPLTIVADGPNDPDAELLAGVLGGAVEVRVVGAETPSDVPHFKLVRDGETLRLAEMGAGEHGGFVVGRLTAASAALDADAGAPPADLGLTPSPAKPVMALVSESERAAWAAALLARSREGGAGILIAGRDAAIFENGAERALSADAVTLARAATDCHAVILAGAVPAAVQPFTLRAMRDGVPLVDAGGDARADARDAPADPRGALAVADGLASDAYAVSEITTRARQRYDYSYRPSRLRQRTVAYLALLRSAARETAAPTPTSVPALPRRPVTAAIKISAPTLGTAQGWGDFHFANALRAALQRLGWVARVDCRDAWEPSGGDEATITLRGRHRYRGAADAINLLWVISHPDRLTPQETADYAHVFVASDVFANVLRTRTTTPVSVLHQATDPAVFRPPAEPVAMTAPALFVGNSRREYRAMVRWCVEAGIEVHVCGQLWSGLIPDRMILGEHIGNADLHRWYGATPILLNDHWDTMRAMGFLSNRLFDGSAAGAFIITDPVRGLAPVFGDAIETAADSAELKDKVAFYLAHPEQAREKAERARAIVLAGHTFDARARTIVEVCEAAAARRSAP